MSSKFSLSDLHDCIMDLHNRRWARQLGLHEAHQLATLQVRESQSFATDGTRNQRVAGRRVRPSDARPSLTLIETEK